MKKIISIFSITLIILFSACNDDYMDRFPETSIGTENFFKSEEDLKMFIYNFYSFAGINNYGDDGYLTTDNSANTGSTELKNIMLSSNPSSATITEGWSWETLRDINLFLENFRNADISEDLLAHYEGLARFFRARFYMEKIKRFSDVPWYDQVIGTSDEELLFKSRDPRDMVVQKIFEDYEFASQNVKTDQPVGAVNKWVVLAYKARHALHEGTFRKYHSELELQSSANTYIQIAKDAAKEIMDNGGFSIYSTGNIQSDYSSLFNSQNLTSNPEIIFANSSEDEVKNSGWWEWMFGNYEVSPSKDLLQAYLMSDGSYYSSQVSPETNSFVEEFENRDPRLKQTYAFPGWELINTGTYAQGGGIYKQQLQKNFTGYHQIKGFINSTDQTTQNGVDFPSIRFAEMLLIYAEAKAELGELSQGDLDNSINKLRERAGMPNLNMDPVIDPVQEARFPNVKSNSQWKEILEIRRERRIEMALEGYRYDDLMRWEAGKILETEPRGLYFSGLGKYDMTGDGVEDIVLLDLSESIPGAGDKEVNSIGETLIYYRVGAQDSDGSFYISGDNQGYIESVKERGNFVAPKYYYRPIPQTHTTVNPNLTQIFGWE
ncbi:MAG: RagB/SusD family nutrient uptake outer membrane protein [Prolixibacteraceae bacterium]|jgi:starch-binding outer membrane protein, SusD/RagB family|nr:RagB/SusD family nutrient uptake outer membrane protein [Prolixibacteraceae bacterium]MBT6765752.1 RagB/SusD family nutrient uptake outer membrane protein [Prolixibacteraceae bacterium]MBT7395595.1 RagB/SusD family nutrient uptake outer membrane protein [Prolixibacteraceae bacterium]